MKEKNCRKYNMFQKQKPTKIILHNKTLFDSVIAVHFSSICLVFEVLYSCQFIYDMQFSISFLFTLCACDLILFSVINFNIYSEPKFNFYCYTIAFSFKLF